MNDDNPYRAEQVLHPIVTNDSPCVPSDAGNSWLHPEYRRAVRVGVILNCVLLLFSSLILDGGVFFRQIAVLTCVHVLLVAVILFSRPKQPTPVMVRIVAFGLFYLLIARLVIGQFI